MFVRSLDPLSPPPSPTEIDMVSLAYLPPPPPCVTTLGCGHWAWVRCPQKRYPVPELDGHVYTGAFLNADRHGRGEMVWCKGDFLKYTGDWVGDMQNGVGEMLYRNGTSYCG